MSARVELPMFCAQCGVGFIANDLRVFTCSPACAATRNRNVLLAKEARDRRQREVICVVCLDPFEARQGSQKTCGTVCRDEHAKARARSRYEPKVPNVAIPCAECGMSFYRFSNTQELCSFACRQKHKADVARKHGKIQCPDCKGMFRKTESRPTYCNPCHLKRYDRARGSKRGVNHPTRPCEVCQKDFRPRDKASKLCSKTCRQKWERVKYEKRRIAEGHVVPAPAPKKVAPPIETPGGLACLKCVHWHPCAGAEMGGQCVIGRYLACKPYAPNAQPFAPRVSP